MQRGPSLFLAEVSYGFFLSVGIIAVLVSLYSLYLGLQYDRKVSLTLARRKHRFRPRICVIMPCKGNEPSLDTNIEAVLKQAYDNYQTVIVTDTVQDPAHAVAKSVLARYPTAKASVYTSEPSTGASGKVAALLTALEKSKGQADVYAFVDSDGLIPPRWLEELVNPLIDESVGSTTGFRWYFPLDGGVWSHIEAAWNASGTNLMFDDRYNFPWGGAMAIRAETLERIGIKQIWANAISDDMTLNSALRSHGYRIVFLPQCTVATFNKATLPRFLEWATRQTVLTKIFNPGLWNYALAAYAFFDLVLLLGPVAAVLGVLLGPSWFIPAALLLSSSGLGILRSIQRSGTFKRAMPEFEREFNKNRVTDAIASFIVPWIMTYCIIESARTSEIEWRGRKYELTGIKPHAAP